MDISLTYALTQADLEAAIRDNRRAARTRYLLSMGLTAAIAIVLISTGDGLNLALGIILVLLCLFQAWAMTVSAAPIAQRWLTRLGPQVELRLADDAYHYDILDEDPSRDWAKTRVVAGRDYLTLTTDRKILVVPCRELTDGQRTEIAAFLRSGRVGKVVKGIPAL